MTCSEDMLMYVHFILCLGGNDRQKNRLKCLKNTLRKLRGTGLTKRVMRKNKAFNEEKNKSKQNKKQTKLNKTSQISSYYS